MARLNGRGFFFAMAGPLALALLGGCVDAPTEAAPLLAVRLVVPNVVFQSIYEVNGTVTVENVGKHQGHVPFRVGDGHFGHVLVQSSSGQETMLHPYLEAHRPEPVVLRPGDEFVQPIALRDYFPDASQETDRPAWIFEPGSFSMTVYWLEDDTAAGPVDFEVES